MSCSCSRGFLRHLPGGREGWERRHNEWVREACEGVCGGGVVCGVGHK